MKRQISDEDVIALFRVRRRQCGFVILAAVAIFASRAAYEHLFGRAGSGPSAWDLICFAAGVGTVVFLMLRYRCPRCNTVPTSEGPGFATVLVFPEHCHKCKARLRSTVRR